jgi:hypothetical protein
MNKKIDSQKTLEVIEKMKLPKLAIIKNGMQLLKKLIMMRH